LRPPIGAGTIQIFPVILQIITAMALDQPIFGLGCQAVSSKPLQIKRMDFLWRRCDDAKAKKTPFYNGWGDGKR
jgi:hypothetical protein